MSPRLSTLDEVLGHVLTGVRPVDPESLSLRAALEGFSAETICAPYALPKHTVARVPGYALCSNDTLGASAHEPILLGLARHVRSSQVLPIGTNAVAPADLIVESGGVIAVLGSVSPGAGVRFAGHDLASDTLIIRAGERIRARHIAVIDAFGIASIAVRRLRIALAGAGATRLWLEGMLVAAGGIITTPDNAELLIVLRDDLLPSVALHPGDGSSLSLTGNVVRLDCSAQLEGAVAAFFALALPVLAKRVGASIRHQTCSLTRGVRSVIGLSEIALFRADEGANAEPLICGQITLEALLAATHATIVPPNLEGYPVGTKLPMIPFEAPL